MTRAPHTPGVFDCVILPGHVITGASVSFTVTVNEHNAIRPPASVTENILVVVPVGKVDPLGRPDICIVVAPGQLSVPTGAVYVTTAPQIPASLPCVIFAGQVMVGDSLSVTVTVNEHEAVNPPASVTVKVFVVVPVGNVAPLGRPAVCAVVAPGQLSVPTGVV